MTEWHGESLNEFDREEVLSNLDEQQIDREFLPFLRTINALPFVVSVQCCIGHLPYEKCPDQTSLPRERTHGWGYLQVLATYEAADWISRNVNWDLLWLENSHLFVEGCREPETTENDSWFIAFAWDASAWPQVAVQCVELLKKFYDKYAE